jgi:hypothetical protein
MVQPRETFQSPPPIYGVNSPAVAGLHDFRREFVCPEESMRYSGSLEQLVFNKFRNVRSSPTIIEFGSGTGEPVISAIINSHFSGTIHGYEINPEAVETAGLLIEKYGLTRQYMIHNASFFDDAPKPQSDYLIANPPYIPCDDGAMLILPGLCGGPEGNDVSKRLLSVGYLNVFLEVSSYSNPGGLLEHAKTLGYKISDFQITQLPFGNYSRQDIVQKRIHEMSEAGKAFFSNNSYLVGSAFFTKSQDAQPDLSVEFLACLTALRSAHKTPHPS